MEYLVYKDNTKFTARLLRSPFKVPFRSIGFHPRLLNWCQVLGAAVPASYTHFFFPVMSCVCGWCCIPVIHPAAWGVVTCLIKCHATLTHRTWWKLVCYLSLPGLFFARDKSMLICQPQLWNVPTAWTIFYTTLVFFVKAFFYWSELTCAEKPCEFNANCYHALTVSSRAIQKDAFVYMCNVRISRHVSLYWYLVWSCFQSISKQSINAFLNVLRRS